MRTSDNCDAFVNLGNINNSYMQIEFGSLGIPSDSVITGGNITFEYADEKDTFTNQRLYCFNGTDGVLTAYPPIQTSDYTVTYELNTSCYTPVSRANDIQVRFGTFFSADFGQLNFDYVSVNVSVADKKEVNITIFNSTGEKAGSAIKIYNSTDDLIISGSDEVVVNLTIYQNYTIELSEQIDSENLTVQIVDLNITGDLNLTTQTVENYSSSLPSGYNRITSVFALNDTGLTYSYATIFIPNSTFIITKLFHCNNAWDFTEGDCDVGGWDVNETTDFNAKSNASHTFFNVTSFDGFGGGGSVWLEVELILPPGDTFVERYGVFDVNATVFCRGGACTDVFGTVRYNHSTKYPDLRVNTTYDDKPLFVNESSPLARKPCPTNSLDQDEYCNITWKVNATGALDSGWELGVLFNSTDTEIVENNTDNVTLTIVPCLEEITIQFSDIGFATLYPNSVGNPATENPNEYFNVTNSGTCTSNLWIKSTDLVDITNDTNTIGYSNISFNNVTDDFSSSYRMSDSYSIGNSSFKKDVSGNTNATTYFFLDLPPSYAEDYQGNITFCVNSSVRGTLC
jgi:hypothetical protein